MEYLHCFTYNPELQSFPTVKNLHEGFLFKSEIGFIHKLILRSADKSKCRATCCTSLSEQSFHGRNFVFGDPLNSWKLQKNVNFYQKLSEIHFFFNHHLFFFPVFFQKKNIERTKLNKKAISFEHHVGSNFSDQRIFGFFSLLVFHLNPMFSKYHHLAMWQLWLFLWASLTHNTNKLTK